MSEQVKALMLNSCAAVMFFGVVLTSAISAQSRPSGKAPGPSASPSPRPVRLAKDYDEMAIANFRIHALHPTKEQEAQLRLMAVSTRRLVAEMMHTKRRALTDDEQQKILTDNRRKAQAILTPGQYQEYCDYEVFILFSLPFQFER